MSDSEFKFSFIVYEDYAIVKGIISRDALKFILKICKEYEFLYVVPNDDEIGFKLVKTVL